MHLRWCVVHIIIISELPLANPIGMLALPVFTTCSDIQAHIGMVWVSRHCILKNAVRIYQICSPVHSIGLVNAGQCCCNFVESMRIDSLYLFAGVHTFCEMNTLAYLQGGLSNHCCPLCQFAISKGIPKRYIL